jgi:hypothetical protein
MSAACRSTCSPIASLDEAFDPHSNVAYAARFLVELHDQTGNWPQAGAHYHSQTPELAAPYKAKLLATWEAAQRRGDQPSLQLASLDPADEPRLPLGLSLPVAQDARRPAPDSASHADPLGRGDQERLAATRAADSYRQAKLEEYRQKHGLNPAG